MRDIADEYTWTGIAASLIDGKTTHVIRGVSMRKYGSMSDEAKARLQVFWKRKQYLIINEYSMLSKSFLTQLPQNIDIGKQGSETHHSGHSFGGVNIILCVGCARGNPLGV